MKLKKKPKKFRKTCSNAGFSFLGLKGRKAFIADFMVDIFAIILFALTILFFGILYKWSANASEEKLTQFKGVTFSNYLAEVYLRTPITVNDNDMTMAELIAFYDYNQTHKIIHDMEKTGIIEGITNFMAGMTATSIDNGFVLGEQNPYMVAINDITDSFITDNFESFGTCYIFSIKGQGFKLLKHGDTNACSTEIPVYGVLPVQIGVQAKYNMEDYEKLLEKIPKEYYLTYVPSIDPRKPPIEVVIVYDLKALFKVKNFGDSIMEDAS